MKKYLILGAALITLVACKPDEPNTGGSDDTTSVQPAPTSPDGLDLAAFRSWPQGEVTQADPDAIGQNNLIFVVDRSGSMDEGACGANGTKSQVVASALASFMPQIPTDVAVGYIDFGRSNEVRVPLGVNNRAALIAAAEGHLPDMGDTYVGHATEVAFDILTKQGLNQGATGTYRIVLIVDGGATDDRTLDQVLTQINHTPVEILTAGFCIGAGHELNQPNDMVYVEAANVDQLVAVLQAAVSAEAPAFSADFTQTDTPAVTE